MDDVRSEVNKMIKDEDGMSDGIGEESECPECQMTTHYSHVMFDEIQKFDKEVVDFLVARSPGLPFPHRLKGHA